MTKVERQENLAAKEASRMGELWSVRSLHQRIERP